MVITTKNSAGFAEFFMRGIKRLHKMLLPNFNKQRAVIVKKCKVVSIN